MHKELEELEAAWDHIETVYQGHLDRVMRKVAADWQKRFPKRRIRFLDAMGSSGWLVDGEWITHGRWGRLIDHSLFEDGRTVHGNEVYSVNGVLDDLINALMWYDEFTRRCNVQIEFELPPLKEKR